jgi:4-hydroxythreonine-4-phosphate dehydrogenase
MTSPQKKIGLTMGDPNGIGPEIVLKALADPSIVQSGHRFTVYGSRRVLEHYTDQFNLPRPDNARIDLIDIDDSGYQFAPGTVNGNAGHLAFKYIEAAINDALSGKLKTVVTAPIHKEALRQGTVPYLDHTAMFTELSSSRRTMTLFVTRALRVFFFTRHISFREIPDKLNRPDLVASLQDCDRYMRQIGIENPHIALAALNPHGGDSGLFGREEIDILAPAVAEANNSGLRVSGPVPGDSVFHQAAEGNFDAVLSLYHDQGHIAAKTYDFHRTVALTMGLPFLRTSVDHGTAMDLAAKNRANATSMIEAIHAAIKYGW